MDIMLRRRRVRRWRQQRISTNRRLLRDSADPLSMDPKLFVRYYRVSKELYSFLCEILGNRIGTPQRCTSITPEVKILTTLNFLATGGYQKPVGQDWLAPLSQPSVSRCVEEVVNALNELLPTYIKFPTTEQERNVIKQGFYDKFGMPGVIGCIDGTLIAIVAPRNHPSEAAFYCRKGYHAINAAIICDSDMRIISICAKFGGAAHDSYVWRSWSVSRFLEDEHNSGKIGWLLGDSGYPQKPWLMTPVLHAADHTPEAHYTNMHVHTRVCVERCIGLLKARWRCLLRHRVLHYEPIKCARIINACVVLHNLCLNHDNPIDDIAYDTSGSTSDDDISDDPLASIPIGSFAGEHARRQYIQVLWDNRN